MHLRSSSTPILSSWMDEVVMESVPHIPRSRSSSFTLTASLPPPCNDSSRRRRSIDGADITRVSSAPLKQGKQQPPLPPPRSEKTSAAARRRSLDGAETTRLSSLPFKQAKQQDGVVVDARIFTYSGLDGGGGRGRKHLDFNQGGKSNNSNMDQHYLSMIQADPGNDLLLGNYARFLKEVKGELGKAEEYCGRAILANPNNANFLSLYAEIIWQRHKDTTRAECYFDQAIEAAPEDSYVMASYARFLWDAEQAEIEDGHPLHSNFTNGTTLITAS